MGKLSLRVNLNSSPLLGQIPRITLSLENHVYFLDNSVFTHSNQNVEVDNLQVAFISKTDSIGPVFRKDESIKVQMAHTGRMAGLLNGILLLFS